MRLGLGAAVGGCCCRVVAAVTERLLLAVFPLCSAPSLCAGAAFAWSCLPTTGCIYRKHRHSMYNTH